MSQQSISQSTDIENGSPGPTIVSAKFINEVKKVLQDLNELRAKPTPIYLDAMGNAKDELIDLHLFVPLNRTLYAVNVRKLGDEAFSAVGNTGVYEQQLTELASRKYEQQKKFLSGLARCIDQDISNRDPDKVRWLNPADAKDLRFYQKLDHASDWIMKRVEIFPSLYEVCITKLSKLNSADWLRLAEQESEQRVHDAKRKSKKVRTEKKSRSPEVFCDDQ
ncbi:hypothetical protein F25303_10519 [Fusarium sp. NRRL 25303]|nr:hypothetical protein F25303_10519 [Fusarium sp. NRRL 25303]